MPEDKAAKRVPRDSERDIASADFLFGDDPPDEAPRLASQPVVVPGTSSTGDVFDLAGPPPSSHEIPVANVPLLEEQKAGPKKTSSAAPAVDESKLDPSRLVEEVWSRGAEWGPNLLVVGVWASVVLLVAYFLLNLELYGIAFLTLVAGGIAGLILAYPILITLERPVRMTPEQAVKDYYHALSHHVPHFRRMWLLLSARGRVSTAFGSLDGFKAYWQGRLAQLRAFGQPAPFAPLVFEVVDFKSEKSAGRIRIEAEFAVKVSVRGQRKQGPIDWIKKKIALVRGPDKMWYLEDGTLPQQEQSAKAPR
jgi:hypothetical protein